MLASLGGEGWGAAQNKAGSGIAFKKYVGNKKLLPLLYRNSSGMMLTETENEQKVVAFPSFHSAGFSGAPPIGGTLQGARVYP